MIEAKQRKTAFGAKYNGEKRKGFGKKHTIQIFLGQNTTDQDGIGGKMQWKKVSGFGKKQTT